jgi:hypothetical protein
MSESVNWWAVALLFYLLCGLGFTILGIQRLYPLIQRLWARMLSHRERVAGESADAEHRGWREEPRHQH